LSSRGIDLFQLTLERFTRCARRGRSISRAMHPHAGAEQRDGGEEEQGVAVGWSHGWRSPKMSDDRGSADERDILSALLESSTRRIP